ncbi:MAG: divergent polysaccharide deacetylase family protein [Deltaproteobacteria bacterium]|nr:divergent polysaccharide deacetylase family protein [Deltaproteobacteria bacterium]MBW2085205.1 divergent polysaccharide deacetylase family protein [Deltaproteobacteria bacterium]
MATRNTGKSQSSPRSRPKSRKTSASKTRTPSKAKSRPKTKTQTKKKKSSPSSGGRETLWTRMRSNLSFLGLGLTVGVLGAVLILYFIGAFKTPLWWKPAAPPTPQETRTNQPRVITTGPKVYEEHNRLDLQIKKIDQALYRVLKVLKVPEKDIHFVELTQKRTGNSEWHHATIEVLLPARVETERLTKDFRLALHQLSLDPTPRMSVNRQKQTTRVKVFFNGLLTHTMLFRTPGEAESFPRPGPPPTPVRPRPKVAIIIDDLGMDLNQAHCFLDLKTPLALSILPYQQYSRKVAQAAHKKGRVVMLHLPMEPAQYPLVNPGKGALLWSMSREEIEARVREAIEDVPFVVGVNNHMGSRFTEDADRMGWVLKEIKKHDLYFLDSRTSIRSQGYAMARSLGVRTAERTVFLDNVQEAKAIRIQIRRLVALARQCGQAIAIGHPYPITCQVLKNEYNYLKSQVELVPVTSLLR